MSWRIAVDVGGTFTDVVAYDDRTGRKVVRKTSSTPEDFSTGFFRGLTEIAEAVGASPEEVSSIVHGTTAATNAIVEADYARTGLIVNRGYREMLECARQLVPGDFGDISWWVKPPRVVPLELVREVEGRLDFQGEELRPLDEDGVRAVARDFRDRGITAVAVSLLHSYRDARHEQRVRELLLEEHPGCHVSISSEVIREYREYERTLSTCLNTGLKPMVSSYVGRLHERAGEVVGDAPLYIMKSSGGVASTKEFVERPIGAVLSGPAAGVIAAAAISRELGHADIITFDVGGTSADIALIEGNAPRLRSEGRIDIYDLKIPMIDMTAVGAGGGSIAWLAAGGSLRVGPQSAGSSPGPVCYPGGGTEPTVTDAHLVLGRVSPYLLDGSIQLDVDKATAAIRARIAEPLGLDTDAAANAILEIAIQNMAAGTRLVSVRQGRDPRDFALFAFGGAGGLHALRTAQALGIGTVIVPSSPGATSAEGLLLSDLRLDEVVTDVQHQDEIDAGKVAERIDALRGTMAQELADQGFGTERTRFEQFFELRYVGQAHELRVTYDLDGAAQDHAPIDDVIRDFHATHEDQFGFSYADTAAVELVNLGVTGHGLLATPLAKAAGGSSSGSWDGALKGTRLVYDPATGRRSERPVYDRAEAPVGVPLHGVAIVEQYDSTIVVEDGWTVESDGHGHLVLTHAPGDQEEKA